MAQVDERGCRDKEDLEDPEACVRDRERSIVAGQLAAGAFCVTFHVRLLISPYFIYASSQDEDPEEEKNAHPDLPHHGGV